MTHSTLILRLPQRWKIVAALSAALWCAAATADEMGTTELLTTYKYDYVTIEHAGHEITGGSLRGTTTVTRSDVGPFVEGESSLIACIIYASKTDTGLDLEAPCTNTDTSGDKWFWLAKRSAGDIQVGGEGRWEVPGGTGKYKGLSGSCTYSTRYMEDNWIVTRTRCKWSIQ